MKLGTVMKIGIGFMFLFYFTNYIRTDGLYSDPLAFLEYIPLYFNTYLLHGLVVEDYSLGFLETAPFLFTKIVSIFGYQINNGEFDLSVMLTKVYFPQHWEVFSSTQQWPLESELYFNWFGMYLGWIPLLTYSFVISKLYKSAQGGGYTFSLIYLLELLRILSVVRGGMFAWQLPIYLLQYVVIWLVIKYFVSRIR